MADLTVHGRQVSNFFELLGDGENALTFAVGWALPQSPHLLNLLLDEIFDQRVDSIEAVIRLQGYESEHGYTDIEVDAPNAGCAIIGMPLSTLSLETRAACSLNQLKFSVYNAGSESIILGVGERLFPIWFVSCTRRTRTNILDHKGQMSITLEDVMQLQGEVASPAALKEGNR
jgi:hypothetical protein